MSLPSRISGNISAGRRASRYDGRSAAMPFHSFGSSSATARETRCSRHVYGYSRIHSRTPSSPAMSEGLQRDLHVALARERAGGRRDRLGNRLFEAHQRRLKGPAPAPPAARAALSADDPRVRRRSAASTW